MIGFIEASAMKICYNRIGEKMKLEEMFCVKCFKKTSHSYIESAIQDGIKIFDIYSCNDCGETKIQGIREIQDPNYKPDYR